jgi:hypothetical protein
LLTKYRHLLCTLTVKSRAGYSEVIAGNHHGTFEIEKQFRLLMDTLKSLNICIDGLIMNADAGFDCQTLRNLCAEHGIELNL